MANKISTKMKLYWNDCGRGIESPDASPATIDQVNLTWSDEVRGVEGNFLGLVDDRNRAIQFLFLSGIPDHVEDAGYLEIVRLDFPIPEKKGSYWAQVKIDDVYELIERAFKLGADHEHFDVEFETW